MEKNPFYFSGKSKVVNSLSNQNDSFTNRPLIFKLKLGGSFDKYVIILVKNSAPNNMTLYFENPVHFPEHGSITVNETWHPTAPLLAVSSFSQDKGGFVTIFDDVGDPLPDVIFPYHRSFQTTALAWHPERTILVAGWENGELKIWNGDDKNFANVSGPHKSPITLLAFSEKGGRLVSCDSSGSLVGWKMDSKGEAATVFHLELKESITHLTFRLTVRSQPEFDIEGLAKAAVNGDEHALDIFSNWRPKTTARKFRVADGSDNFSFFIGSQLGSVYYVNASGSCAEVLNTEGTPLTNILYHTQKDILVLMMEGLTIGYFSVDSQGHLTERAKVKLSGRIQSRAIGSQGLVWAGNNLLAVLTGDLTVRMWDIDTNDNYVLPTSLKIYDEKHHTINEIFTCIAYCKLNQTLCAGTNIGRIYFWTRAQNSDIIDSIEDSWELNNVNTISGTVKQITWGSTYLRQPLLSVNCVTSVYIMKEQTICVCFSKKIWATQKTASQVLLESEKSNKLLQLELQVSDMCINENYFVITNGRTIVAYEITWGHSDRKFELNSKLSKHNEEDIDFAEKSLATFSCDNEGITIFNKTILALTSKGVSLRTHIGSPITLINSVGSEGEIIGMDVTGNYLTLFTMDGYIKIYDLNETEYKPITASKNVFDICQDFGEVIQAKTNCTGEKVALTLAAANLIPDGKIYIWELENDNCVTYNFHKFADFESQENDNPEVLDDEGDVDANGNKDDVKAMYDEICKNRVPLALYWSNEDSRLLICDAKRVKLPTEPHKGMGAILKRSQSDVKKELKDEDHIIITMFVSSEHGIKIHDIRATDINARLLGVATPYISTLQKLSLERELMSDFIGLEDCNETTREAVLDFSYNLSLGNMDAAFRAIKLKLVQSTGVWNSLARMCVKTRRLDVAGVCLGHMGNARAARALRLAMADKSLSLEAKVAVLAIHLGMLDEAEQLYMQCDRYDLLNKLLRSRNKMDAAHAIAESKDRIHLRNTEYIWAKMLEEAGDLKEAAIRYERANTHRFDVPRMLVDHPGQLEAYMNKTNDPDLLKWWGQYIESQGDMNAALKIYAQAGDIYSQVRILCFLGEEARAADLARSNTDKAAFYHMARHYETTDDIEKAVSFFSKANAYGNAVRLCKENHMADELWNIGSVAGPREKLECAKYFEEVGHLEKAVILYHRASMLHKALDLAFKTQQYDTLQEIGSELTTDSDPALVEKCANYFVTNEQFDRAVDLLAIAKKFKEAIAICLEHNVQLTEDLVEKLTPEKDQVDETTRMSILENLAESLMVQGSYHLATKKFTQAGDKVRAMKSLLKSGDTDKIIFFAGVSRQPEIYVMAANYLQTLDWQNKPEVLKNIITFYSKGKALDLLANFYVACAQVEIDEFQNYEKALGALTEASRCLAKLGSTKDSYQHQRASEIVQQRLTLIKRFVDIRRLFERGDEQAGITQCRQLLLMNGQELESIIRRGDIYALMIHHSVKNGHFSEAKDLFVELRQVLASTGSTPITYYLSRELIEALAQGLGIPASLLVPVSPKREENVDYGEEVEEVIED